MDGRYDDAWSVYLQLKADQMTDAEAHYLGGRAALGRGDLHGVKNAMQNAMAAGAEGQTLGQTRLVLGEVQRRIGELNEAAETLEGFLSGLDEYPELGAMWRGAGLHNLGLAYRQLGRLEDARQSYLQAADAFRQDGLTDMLGKTLWTLDHIRRCVCRSDEGTRSLAPGARSPTTGRLEDGTCHGRCSD
jgi:tetratricopeptide (TPR) repeat protein